MGCWRLSQQPTEGSNPPWNGPLIYPRACTPITDDLVQFKDSCLTNVHVFSCGGRKLCGISEYLHFQMTQIKFYTLEVGQVGKKRGLQFCTIDWTCEALQQCNLDVNPGVFESMQFNWRQLENNLVKTATASRDVTFTHLNSLAHWSSELKNLRDWFI